LGLVIVFCPEAGLGAVGLGLEAILQLFYELVEQR
jgi:hypothetical protein